MVWLLAQIWSTWISVIPLASVPTASKGLRNWFRGGGVGLAQFPPLFVLIFLFILFYFDLFNFSFQIFSNFKLIFVSSQFLLFLHFFKIFFVFIFAVYVKILKQGAGMKISDKFVDISSIYPISVMFDTIYAMTDISPIYRGNIMSVAHARISLIFR